MSNSAMGCGSYILAMLAVLAGSYGPAAAGEEATVKAFAAWIGDGRTFQTGPKEATFIGDLAGPMFVETEQGIIKTGRLLCPAIVEIGLDDGKQRGEGRCTITAPDGARVYAEISCTGVYMVGCNGELKLTGGTGRFSGITGGGKVTIRSDLRQIGAASEGSVKEDASGSLVLPEFHYKIP
jgi:hypothetical protein